MAAVVLRFASQILCLLLSFTNTEITVPLQCLEKKAYKNYSEYFISDYKSIHHSVREHIRMC